MVKCDQCGKEVKGPGQLSTHKRFCGQPPTYDPATFWAKVDIRGDDECWEYQGYVTPEGYGWAYTGTMKGQRTHGAHRQSWILTHGPIEGDLQILHHCDNRRCCNPKHLFIGTHQDNMRDMVQKERHRFGRNNPNRKTA